MSKQLKYGPVMKENIAINLFRGMGASEVIPAGGCYVKRDGNGHGNMEVAGDGDALIAGYVFPTELDSGKKYQTCSSTEGGTIVPFIPVESMIGVAVRLPINTNPPTTKAAMRDLYDDTCDLSVSDNAQGVQAGTSAEDTVKIINGDEEDFEWVDVVVSVEKVTSQAEVA